MSTSQKFSLSLLVTVLLGLCLFGTSLPVAAAGSIFISSGSGSCNQMTITYSTADVSSDPFLILWTLTYADETFIADGTITSPGDSPSRTVTITLPKTLVPGREHMITLDIDGTADSRHFFTGACDSSASSSSSTSVELPPCKLSDERLDETCGSAPIVVYSQGREDGCYVSIYSPYGRADGKTVLLLQATPAETAAAQAHEGNAVIDSVEVVNLGTVTVYWLPGTGEFQINAGPNEEGKVYVVNFTGCPATNVYTSNSYQEAQ